MSSNVRMVSTKKAKQQRNVQKDLVQPFLRIKVHQEVVIEEHTVATPFHPEAARGGGGGRGISGVMCRQ